ncbi:serine/threonine-protein kinase [uncultured Thiodictyon sp.]|uniref:serine/threonine-protein kinase n=1 Tax=uncultured Thiodictyon sp. TaxID=1846217 RepID=UPI0025E2207A|nr:serine/threonine-protein kinase [uncultured Thiodictyon sp.]
MESRTRSPADARCPGCFTAQGAANPCPDCGYDERAERAHFLLPHRTPLHGQYLVGRVLGKPGGFGITYLGWDLGLETRVAIKEYLPREWAGRDPDRPNVSPHSREEGELFRYGLDRFIGEARTLAQLDHPNVVRVRAYFTANGTAYLVMDYYEGQTLAERVERGGRLPEPVAQELMLRVLDGLRAVHAKGFLHRDLKPQNIYLAATAGSAPRPILIDFGAARQAPDGRARTLTVVYTAGYAPIEQYHEKGEQGPWTDIYSAAAIHYRLVTGKTLPDSIARLAGATLRPAAEFGVSKPLSDALAAALALAPEDRPRTVEAFRTLLDRAAQPAHPNRRRWPWLVAALGVLLLIGLGAWYQYREVQASLHRAADRQAYETASAADTAVAYDAYLGGCAEHGCGQRAQAEQRSAELAAIKQAADVVRAADAAEYAKAAAANTAQSYQDYLAGCADRDCENRANAQNFLGTSYEEGRGVTRDDQEAVGWYRMAAEQGNVYGEYNLGRMYDSGRGLKKDGDEALRWFHKAAEQGYAQAESVILGISLGHIGGRRAAEELESLQKAAERGNVDAQNALGKYDTKDGREAAHWYRMAAEQGDAHGQTDLARLYLSGKGLERDDREAVKWYLKAAEQGNYYAQYELGRLLADTNSAVYDGREAVRWLRQADEQKDDANLMFIAGQDAAGILGEIYRDGRGVECDGAEAIRWFRRSARQNNMKSANSLGEMYRDGLGVAKDRQEALLWFRIAADGKNADAKAALAEMQRLGSD